MIRRRRRGKERLVLTINTITQYVASLGHGAAVVRSLLRSTLLQPPDLVLHPQLLGLGRVEAEVLGAVGAAGPAHDGAGPGRVPRQEGRDVKDVAPGDEPARLRRRMAPHTTSTRTRCSGRAVPVACFLTLASPLW